MAPIKFEENMKEKLEERTINPSAKSWDVLANRLDDAPVKKKTNRFWFISVAASFIGVLLLITGIVNYNNEGANEVVETEINTTKENIKINKDAILDQGSKNEEIVESEIEAKNKIETEALKNQFVNREAQTLVNTESKKQKKSLKAEANMKTLEKNKNNKKEEVNKDYIALNVKQDNLKTVVLKNATIAEENIALNPTTKNEIIKVTDNELDALLNNAQKDIAEKSSSNPVPLDYNELLQDVEDNLEESFRDKILKTVKGGYHSVKSYVAERNE